jgi:signal transduction histidine kinase
MEARPQQVRRFLQLFIWILVLVGLYLSSLYNYLLFHSLAEMFSVVIAVGVFAIAWNSRRFLENNYLLFLGIAFLFVGAIDLVHTLAYKGMQIFPGFGANLPTQLWIAARYLEAASVLLALWFIHRRLNLVAIFAGYSLTFTLILLTIFYWKIFPSCFVEGVGLTPFKKISEYVICGILAGALALLWQRRADFEGNVLRLIVWSIIMTMGSELAFTFYVSVYGLSNFIGHILKILSFYLIYKALIETGLVKPYNLLFRNLKLSEEALRKRTVELEFVNRELESFSYSVSHDLKAPIRAIQGFSRMLVGEHAARLDEEGHRLLDVIVSNTQTMSNLIDDLLALSRLGRQELKKDSVNLTAMAGQVFERLKSQEPERNLQLVLKDLPSAHGDPSLLYQVMINLMGNAIKYTKSRKAAVIEVEGKNSDNETIYCVKDNGIGFDERYADKIFGVFQRLHRSEHYEGSGVGLAIVKRIIQRHGGRVWGEGKVDEGAVFCFALPKERVARPGS